MIKKGAGIAIYYKDKILLVHPKNAAWHGTYSIPKGEIEPDEDIKQAAIRETFEETGIKINEKDINTPLLINNVKNEVITKELHYFVLRINSLSEIGLPDITESKTGSIILPKEQLQASEIDWAGFVPLQDAEKRIVKYQLPIINSEIVGATTSQRIAKTFTPDFISTETKGGFFLQPVSDLGKELTKKYKGVYMNKFFVTEDGYNYFLGNAVIEYEDKENPEPTAKQLSSEIYTHALNEISEWDASKICSYLGITEQQYSAEPQLYNEKAANKLYTQRLETFNNIVADNPIEIGTDEKIIWGNKEIIFKDFDEVKEYCIKNCNKSVILTDLKKITGIDGKVYIFAKNTDEGLVYELEKMPIKEKVRKFLSMLK